MKIYIRACFAFVLAQFRAERGYNVVAFESNELVIVFDPFAVGVLLRSHAFQADNLVSLNNDL